MNSYFTWFKKLINILIKIFYILAIIATLFVFTSSFNGIVKIALLIVAFIGFSLSMYFFRGNIKSKIEFSIEKISKVDEKKLLLIIVITLIVLKIIYTLLFYFDSTLGGDIELYNQIGDELLNSGTIAPDMIAHLLGIGVHLAIFKFIKLPLHIGMFILLLCGTIINFLSFKKIVGKEKAFILIMLYVIMPSTNLLSFCITHEILVYFYLSLFLFMFNNLIYENSRVKLVIYLLFTILATILVCFVNPGGYIVYVIMLLSLILSNIKSVKKIVIVICLLLSLVGNTLITNSINNNSGNSTSLNSYVILIHGTNPQSLGEQVDGYPMHTIRQYLRENNLEINDDNYIIGAKGVLKNQCLYLISHPINLLKLVSNKIYRLWSGNHYSIELGYKYNAMNEYVYYGMLLISTLIYLFVISISILYREKNNDDVSISNYKLALLGAFVVTMMSIVTNKYSLYVTLFIYFISFYKIDMDNK